MRSFKNVVILNMDGVPDKSGDFFDKTSIISHVTPSLPIYSSATAHRIAVGEVTNIRPENDQVLVDLEFYNDLTPIDLKLIPGFAGKILNRIVNHVLEAKLEFVDLCSFNYDPRIPTMNSYTLLTGAQATFSLEKGSHPIAAITGIDWAKSDTECKCDSLLHGHSDGCAWKK